MSYKAHLSVPRGKYTGIMVIKKMNEREFRVAFFSEMGMSYFEGTWSGTSYPADLKINSINPFLSSSSIRNTLEAGLNLLLIRPGDLLDIDVFKDKDMNLWVKGITTGGGYYWGQVHHNGRVTRAYLANEKKAQARFEYPSEEVEYPSVIEVKDTKSKTIMLLNRI